MPQDELIQQEGHIFDWIERVFSQGIHRPGCPADRSTEAFCLKRYGAR